MLTKSKGQFGSGDQLRRYFKTLVGNSAGGLSAISRQSKSSIEQTAKKTWRSTGCPVRVSASKFLLTKKLVHD